MTRQALLRTLSSLTIASALSLFTVANAEETAGTLLLDGRILVDGGGLDDATITVFQDNVEHGRLTESLKEFELKLALGHTYQLVFAKPGCVTKELVFDTNTSMDIPRGSVFTFRFQVSLAAAQAAGDYRYDGPVAIIRFNPEEREFDYDRQHVSPRIVKAAPRTRREAKPFADPTNEFAAWVEEKRSQR